VISFFNLPCAIRYRDGKTRNDVGAGHYLQAGITPAVPYFSRTGT
jgi:hypothetical protein